MIPIPQLDAAIQTYLVEFEASRARDTFTYTHNILLKLLEATGDVAVSSVQNWHLNKLLAEAPPGRHQRILQVVRTFLRWAHERWPGHPIYIPAVGIKPLKPPKNFMMDAVHLIRQVRALATRMALPPQRLAFLCGWLWGLRLEDVVQLTPTTIMDQPMTPEIYMIVSHTDRLRSPGAVLMFEPWFGSCRRRAYRVWREWSGGFRYMNVIKAGALAQLHAGIAMERAKQWPNLLWEGLPPLDSQNIGRLSLPWDAS